MNNIDKDLIMKKKSCIIRLIFSIIGIICAVFSFILWQFQNIPNPDYYYNYIRLEWENWNEIYPTYSSLIWDEVIIGIVISLAVFIFITIIGLLFSKKLQEKLLLFLKNQKYNNIKVENQAAI